MSHTHCTIPLWLVFILQSLVVGGAFIAVILVLVLQQQDQYQSAVFEKIGLQLSVSELALTGPILTRERVHHQFARRLELDKSLWYQVGDNISTERIARYFNLSFFIMYEDPLAYTVYLHRLDPSNPLPPGSPNGPLRYGSLGLTNEFLAGISNYDGTVTVAPNPTFPLQFASHITIAQEISHSSWSNSVRHTLTPQWLGPGIFVNTVSGIAQFVSALAHPLEINTTLGVASLSVAYTIDVRYLVELSKKAILTPTTKGLLVSRMVDDIIASMNTGVELFNPDNVKSWTLNDFPDQALVGQFRDTNAKCTVADNCTVYAKEDGNEIKTLLYMTTGFQYRMHLFQITPRDFYFAAGERSVVIGIVIGVVAAVVVLVSCVVIWFAVRGPVRRLRESMELAAVMRNDEVADTSSVLTELDLLSQSFTQMNGKLLQARAFMPQSLLCGTEDGDDDVDALGGDDEEGSMEGSFRSSQPGHGISGRSDVHRASGPSDMKEGSFIFDSSFRSDQMDQGNVPTSLLSSGVFADNQSSSGTLGASTIGPLNTHALRLRSPKSNDTTTGSVASSGIRKRAAKRGLYEIRSLVTKKVGVLMINARGTHGLATSGGAAKLEREQVRLVELVERCARAEKGVVDAFQGDHFVLTFNAVRAVGSPGRNGALVGLSVEEGAQRDGLALGRFSMGLSVGRAHVGNVGSATMKKNCTVGGVYTNAVGLERLAKRVGRTCVVNGRCLNDLEHVVYFMLLGSVQLSSDTRDVAGCVMSRVEGATGDQEWLYQMEGKADPYREYNELVETYLNEGAEAAAAGVAALGARVDDPVGGFVPGAIPHLLALLDRRRRIEAMGAEDLSALHVGGRHPFDADFDMRSA